MSEIDSLNSSFYYAGVQNSTNEAIKNRKNEKTSSVKKNKFKDLLSAQPEEETSFVTKGLPPEIAKLSFEDAAVYLKDAVDIAGDALSSEVTSENIQNFKKAVSQFLTFVVENNYQVTSKRQRRMKIVSPVNFFSTYNTKGHLADPKVQVNIINEKLNELTKFTLETQKNNLQILSKIGEIKGLIVDLMSS